MTITYRMPLPAFPALPLPPMAPAGQGGAQTAASPAPSPWEALARAGVPLTVTPGGRPVLKTGAASEPGHLMRPPEIEGMPQMPSPPGWLTGGLFQPLEPVAPFDLGNQVRRLHTQGAPGQ